MGIDGFGAEAKLAGNLTRGEALSDHLENLDLAIGETFDGRFAKIRFGPDRELDHALGSALAEIHLATENFANRTDNAAADLLFVDVANRARPQRPFGEHKLVVHGEDEQFHIRERSVEVFDQLNAAAVG